MGARSKIKRLRRRVEGFVKTLPTAAQRLESVNELVAMGVVRKKDAAVLLADDIAAGVERARVQMAGEANALRKDLVQQM